MRTAVQHFLQHFAFGWMPLYKQEILGRLLLSKKVEHQQHQSTPNNAKQNKLDDGLTKQKMALRMKMIAKNMLHCLIKKISLQNSL